MLVLLLVLGVGVGAVSHANTPSILQSHLIDACQGYPVECEKGCGRHDIPRKEVRRHSELQGNYQSSH